MCNSIGSPPSALRGNVTVTILQPGGAHTEKLPMDFWDSTPQANPALWKVNIETLRRFSHRQEAQGHAVAFEIPRSCEPAYRAHQGQFSDIHVEIVDDAPSLSPASNPVGGSVNAFREPERPEVVFYEVPRGGRGDFCRVSEAVSHALAHAFLHADHPSLSDTAMQFHDTWGDVFAEQFAELRHLG